MRSHCDEDDVVYEFEPACECPRSTPGEVFWRSIAAAAAPVVLATIVNLMGTGLQRFMGEVEVIEVEEPDDEPEEPPRHGDVPKRKAPNVLVIKTSARCGKTAHTRDEIARILTMLDRRGYDAAEREREETSRLLVGITGRDCDRNVPPCRDYKRGWALVARGGKVHRVTTIEQFDALTGFVPRRRSN
jgi:hypothetical protein